MADPRMEAIGKIGGFFAHPSVAMVDLTAQLAIGDTVCIKGHTTDFQQVVESMQVDRAPVTSAATGQSVGVKVKDRCRKGDVVYKMVN